MYLEDAEDERQSLAQERAKHRVTPVCDDRVSGIDPLEVVGASGFEPPTPRSRSGQELPALSVLSVPRIGLVAPRWAPLWSG